MYDEELIGVLQSISFPRYFLIESKKKFYCHGTVLHKRYYGWESGNFIPTKMWS